MPKCPQCGIDRKDISTPCSICGHSSESSNKASKQPAETNQDATDWSKIKKELLDNKKLWDALESKLQGLRDSGEIISGISRDSKADMLIFILKHGGSLDNLPSIIRSEFPQLLTNEEVVSGKGCLLPLLITIGGACAILAMTLKI
jgi:hypothetical protein